MFSHPQTWNILEIQINPVPFHHFLCIAVILEADDRFKDHPFVALVHRQITWLRELYDSKADQWQLPTIVHHVDEHVINMLSIIQWLSHRCCVQTSTLHRFLLEGYPIKYPH